MPAPQRSKKQAAADTTADVVVVAAGVEYPLRLNEISALDATALRHATGMSVQAMMSQVTDENGMDLDIIASIVFLSRRQAGEFPLSYAKVAEAITYETEIEVRDGQEADAPGEAPAAD